MTMEHAQGAPGETRFGEGYITLNAGRAAIELDVTNTGDRAVQVGSHYHFFEANPALRFPRSQAFGMRLNIPSGTAVRFEAGQSHRVSLVPYGGRQHIAGFRAATNGKAMDVALQKLRDQGIDVDVEADA